MLLKKRETLRPVFKPNLDMHASLPLTTALHGGDASRIQGNISYSGGHLAHRSDSPRVGSCPCSRCNIHLEDSRASITLLHRKGSSYVP